MESLYVFKSLCFAFFYEINTVEVVRRIHVVTIFHFLYGLHTPLPRDPITCAAALTFSPYYCTIVTHPDSFPFVSCYA